MSKQQQVTTSTTDPTPTKRRRTAEEKNAAEAEKREKAVQRMADRRLAIDLEIRALTKEAEDIDDSIDAETRIISALRGTNGKVAVTL